MAGSNVQQSKYMYPELRDDDEYMNVAIQNDQLLRKYNEDMERILSNCWNGHDKRQQAEDRRVF